MKCGKTKVVEGLQLVDWLANARDTVLFVFLQVFKSRKIKISSGTVREKSCNISFKNAYEP